MSAFLLLSRLDSLPLPRLNVLRKLEIALDTLEEARHYPLTLLRTSADELHILSKLGAPLLGCLSNISTTPEQLAEIKWRRQTLANGNRPAAGRVFGKWPPEVSF